VVALAIQAVIAAGGGKVDIKKIIESLGGIAIDLANGICEHPSSEFM